jgi:hypothetical protein
VTERDTYLEALQRFAGDLRMVQQVEASMQTRGVTFTADHYELLVATYLGARELDGAQRLFDRMAREGVTPSASVRWDVALSTARAGHTKQALALLDELHAESLEPALRHAHGVLSRLPERRAVPGGPRGAAAAGATR